MAHFAKLDIDLKTVLEILRVENDVITDEHGVEQEQVGVKFLTDLTGHPFWKQTYYNGGVRKNFAGIGDTFDTTRNAFIQTQPYASWTLDEVTCRWQPPTPIPTDTTKLWAWDEDTLSWIGTIKEVTE